MVNYTDKLVGRLVKAVDDAGIRKNTIIIFTTDNGTGGGVRGTIGGVRPSGGKASNYEGGVCEPFIVNCPGTVAAGTDTDALTDFSDLLPTFAELGGAPLPKGVTLDGKSFAPLLLGKANDSPRKWILAMGHGGARLDEKGVRGRSDYMDRVLRDKRYKVWLEKGPVISRLYDLKTDPMEKDNLIDSRKLTHVTALNKFQEIVNSQPKVDARPQYRPRKANPWDRKPKENLKPKRENRKNRKEKNGSK
jgi:arylsulfatase A-like enzyme